MSEFSRETLINIIETDHVQCGEASALARMALAAMDSEPVAWSNGCNKSVPAALRYLAEKPRTIGGESSFNTAHLYQLAREIEFMAEAPLYRHAQQPVVPQDVLEALQKVARIRLNLNDFDGDRRGIADCLGDAEEALIEVVNRRAAMLHGAENAESRCGNSPVIPGRWIPVSERMPGRYYVLAADFSGRHYPPSQPNTQVGIHDDWFGDGKPTWDDGDGNDLHLKQVTHWMPLPAAPQEDW